ncbi:solute carrier organic anion transporter family member 1C1-like [Bufo gargarizans]|uniref:solute carrier organic anion transporter family member 1C1-like n=1 Tax=Bufo gargarizans TaxID=30331 RepID=UPI001CF18BE4|nr:solute carrier organic anion transporter family member 1C1-like [Bufo gargarizans]XP_044133990.1 solute carrier organic anion transporter family member 1C1-like [Bufo gargarizans]XP_044133991.1 solute carrier organic anion transporter family member 1C1-like [Bufo gargarizans]
MTVEKESSELNNLNISATVQNGTTTPPQKKKKLPYCASLKTFLVALCFCYFAKAFAGSHMKSSITQIERRFDLSTSTAGLVDGSFEIGNLLMIAFASYFGARLHRPRIIAGSCFVMAFGSFLTAMPHFFMGHYKYDTVKAEMSSSINSTDSTYSVSPCLANTTLTEDIKPECVKETSSNVWIYVLVGNMLRGIGEAPITPLGISYIDDFAEPKNTPLYIACLHTVALFGPMVGFTLSSFFAKLYVDIGFVDLETVTITPQDIRWVGAWWIGFLLAAALMLISGIPFCFIPKSIPKENTQPSLEGQKIKESETSHPKRDDKATVKGFFLSLRDLACNPLYLVVIITTLIQMNSFTGFVTFIPKYAEQQYGQSISTANFITGATTVPAGALGMLLSGVLMMKYKYGLLSASKLVFITNLVSYILFFAVFFIGCENPEVAGMTVSYNGNKLDTLGGNQLFSNCNSNCSCSTTKWDPVCGVNNITYMSACLAGCKSSTGSGKSIVYQNCLCVESMGFPSVNSSVTLGSCPRSGNCDKMFIVYAITQTFTTFIFSISGTASYVIVLWCVCQELRPLAIGVYMLLIRTLAGITSPIYFGALIDRTCLKWGTTACGGRGACRLYDTISFRNTYLGLTVGIRTPTIILFLCFIFMVKNMTPVKKGNAHENGAMKPAHLENGRTVVLETPEIEKQTLM